MAIIIRNGIEYAGGGSGGIEITQADYNALGDKVKTDGVTYFIIDPDEEQSFAENCKVRYVDDPNDENFDWIMLNESGIWKRWKKGYLARHWLVQDGLNKGNLHFDYTSLENYLSLDVSHEEGLTTLTATLKGGRNSTGAARATFDIIDVSSYDKIVFDQTTTFHSYGSDVYYVTFAVKDMAGNTLASYKHSIANPEDTTFTDDVVIDVSSIMEEVTVFITIGAYSSTDSSFVVKEYVKLANVYAE